MLHMPAIVIYLMRMELNFRCHYCKHNRLLRVISWRRLVSCRHMKYMEIYVNYHVKYSSLSAYHGRVKADSITLLELLKENCFYVEKASRPIVLKQRLHCGHKHHIYPPAIQNLIWQNKCLEFVITYISTFFYACWLIWLEFGS